MKELLQKNRKANIIVFTTLLIALLGAIFFEVAYLRSTLVCGKITDKSKLRGVTHVNYSFIVEGETYSNSIAIDDLKKDITMDSLEKVNCIQIEYSFISKSINRFVDKRFLSK
ncbi:hypothetical protein D3C87_35400 [compost metagenome]